MTRTLSLYGPPVSFRRDPGSSHLPVKSGSLTYLGNPLTVTPESSEYYSNDAHCVCLFVCLFVLAHWEENLKGLSLISPAAAACTLFNLEMKSVCCCCNHCRLLRIGGSAKCLKLIQPIIIVEKYAARRLISFCSLLTNPRLFFLHCLVLVEIYNEITFPLG